MAVRRMDHVEVAPDEGARRRGNWCRAGSFRECMGMTVIMSVVVSASQSEWRVRRDEQKQGRKQLHYRSAPSR